MGINIPTSHPLTFCWCLPVTELNSSQRELQQCIPEVNLLGPMAVWMSVESGLKFLICYRQNMVPFSPNHKLKL